jgi:transcriptional regulator with XRE-family HTH domain
MNTATDRIMQLVKDAGVPDRNVRSVLGRVCGVSVQAIRDWQDGKTKNIRHDHLVAIAQHYKVSIDWLLTGNDSTEANPAGPAPIYGSSIFSTLSNEQKLGVIQQLIPTLDDEGRARVLGYLLSLG